MGPIKNGVDDESLNENNVGSFDDQYIETENSSFSANANEPLLSDTNIVSNETQLPNEPPSYDDLENSGLNEFPMIDNPPEAYINRDGIREDTATTYEEMRCMMEDIMNDIEHNFISMLRNLRRNVMEPFLANVWVPFLTIREIINNKIDFQLNRIGDPTILRRFFYIILMSILTYFIITSGFLPNEHGKGNRGMFSDQPVLVEYAKRSIDFAKLERDLEYLSSMPHMSGTKGDGAIRNYIKESFDNNGLKIVNEDEYTVYTNYPGQVSMQVSFEDDDEIVKFNLTQENFNPLSINGELIHKPIIYVGYGSRDTYKELVKSNVITADDISNGYMVLMKYGKLLSEQILMAQEYGVVGIIFMTSKFKENRDLIQQESVGIPQYWVGDSLSPGWYGTVIKGLDIKESKTLPQLLTVPVSYSQGISILQSLNTKVKSDDGSHGIKLPEDKDEEDELFLYSGKLNRTYIDLNVNTTIRESHSIYNVLGKIEGKEQNDKAIIICASRNSINHGSSYPNFGTTILLSLVQLFEQMRYKYHWKPLRNIYFISFGGSEYNSAGATEFFEEKLAPLKDEIYSVIDISQLGLLSYSNRGHRNSNNDLHIETHPLLFRLFQGKQTNAMEKAKRNEHGKNSEVDGESYFHVQSELHDIYVTGVTSYGDWTPFLANGIPVTIFSHPQIKAKDVPVDTSLDTFEQLQAILQEKESREIVKDLVVYILETTLKLIDEPIIPFDLVEYFSYLKIKFKRLSKQIKKLEKSETNRKDLIRFDSVREKLKKWKLIQEEWCRWIDKWYDVVMEHDNGIEPSLLSVHRWAWNRKMSMIGKRQISPVGLTKGRSFYKNIVVGGELYAMNEAMESAGGNEKKFQEALEDSWLFPGVRDAISGEPDWVLAQEQIDIISDALELSAALFAEEINYRTG
ncbi:hypothetical protein TBLA_0D01260 [Henningerozyma blattae CBS 6284]|uniref:Transferrin receptor-like dimerisation domain-containing protein n=1 Tax=Henningerozyma blattae (strain ATCC 34711 / CBS 6284 / DSM 70876 / NBRC 10599 / NRRL Y-10934 / UCD 77-7) TaxID=1071380 RepID=I2H2N2_HENB6|nr:hypothetical protein TBLA_0D01260 [Tetrapisispora blattae CBS 6284]CCH60634.1 hypothetical protein TBLA_0D01260 [Tetrapisispora blattae CBS 6284]